VPFPLTALPFYLKSGFGYSAVQMGLLITPRAERGRLHRSCRPGRWSSATLPAVSGGIGLLLFAAGLATLAMLPADPSALDVVWRMAATVPVSACSRRPTTTP
jgi:MFS transporter, DHA2 family, multidrug resistance protein